MGALCCVSNSSTNVQKLNERNCKVTKKKDIQIKNKVEKVNKIMPNQKKNKSNRTRKEIKEPNHRVQKQMANIREIIPIKQENLIKVFKKTEDMIKKTEDIVKDAQGKIITVKSEIKTITTKMKHMTLEITTTTTTTTTLTSETTSTIKKIACSEKLPAIIPVRIKMKRTTIIITTTATAAAAVAATATTISATALALTTTTTTTTKPKFISKAAIVTTTTIKIMAIGTKMQPTTITSTTSSTSTTKTTAVAIGIVTSETRTTPRPPAVKHTESIMQSSLIVLALLPLAISAFYVRSSYSYDRPDTPDLSVVPTRFGNRLAYSYDSPSYDINTPDVSDNYVVLNGGVGAAWPLRQRLASPLLGRRSYWSGPGLGFLG